MTAKKAAGRARTSHSHSTILVVDDEPGTLEVLMAVLADAGHAVRGASHGRDPLAQLEASPADLLLLDHTMPVLDGAETLRAMKEDERLARTPVVLMSGLPGSLIERRCRGYDTFLRKPFSPDELLEAVGRLLR